MVNDPRADDARLPIRNLTNVDIHTTTVPAGGERPKTDQEQLNDLADSLEADEPMLPKPPLEAQPFPGNSLEPAPVRPFEDRVIFDFLPLTPAQGDHIPKDLMPEFMRRLMGGLAKGEEAGKDKLDMLTEGHEDYVVDGVRAPYYQINRHQITLEREEGARRIREIARADNIPEMEIWRLVRESQQLAQDQRLTPDEAFEQIGGYTKMAEMKAAATGPANDADVLIGGSDDGGDGPAPSEPGFGSSLVIGHENRDLGLQQGTASDPNRYGPSIGRFIPGKEMDSGLDHVIRPDGTDEVFDRKTQVVLRDPETGEYRVFPRREETNEGPLLGVAETISDAIVLGGPGQLIRKGSSLIAGDAARAVDKGREITESLKPPIRSVIEGSRESLDAAGKKLAELYRSVSRGGPIGKESVLIGKVSDEGAALINRELKSGTGKDIDVTGFSHRADPSRVRHVFKKHGDAAKETSRGQIEITEADFEKIPQVLSEFDAIRYAGKTDRGLEAIGYWKKFEGGAVVYIEEVRSGKKTLSLTTMRKHKSWPKDAPIPNPRSRKD